MVFLPKRQSHPHDSSSRNSLVPRQNHTSKLACTDLFHQHINTWLPGSSLSFFFFSSPALFAFWLRSSVVSVLFSLISESVLRNTTLINLIFGLRGWTSVLAHVWPHSVIGLTLSPIDANTLFINSVGLSDWLEKRFLRSSS